MGKLHEELLLLMYSNLWGEISGDGELCFSLGVLYLCMVLSNYSLKKNKLGCFGPV